MTPDEVRRIWDPFPIPEELPEDLRKDWANPKIHRPGQPWSLSGSPIVEGKYYDFEARQVKEVQAGESVTGGPPNIDVYWHNICMVGPPDLFHGFRRGYTGGDVGSYLVKLGDFLSRGGCELYSLNATTYAVVAVVITERPYEEIEKQYCECGLNRV